MKILESFNNKKKEPCLAQFTDPSENLRRKRARENALEVFQDVKNNSDDIFQN